MEIIKTKKIRQSNHLIESPYSQEFTTHEIKLFEIAAAGVTLEDMESASLRVNKRFSLSSNQIATLLNTSVSVISHEIEKTCARIIKKAIHLRKLLDDGSVEFEMINIVPYAKYKNGVLDYDLNYAIIPYLLEINKNFTEFQLSYLLLMRSSYAIKLYKLLYQYKSIKSRVFTIDNLKEQFGIIDKYPQYKNLKQKIIDLSVLQINEFTDLNVKYNEIKLGRKVEKLEFIFELKKVQLSKINQVDVIDASSNSKNNDVLNISSVIESELSTQTRSLITKFIQEKGADYVEASITYAKKNAKANLDKYLSDTLIKGWAEVEVKKLQTKKTNTAQKVQAVKQEQNQKHQQKEIDNLNKSNIEHEWSKLLDKDKLLNDETPFVQHVKHFLDDQQCKSLNIKSPYDTGKTQLLKSILRDYPQFKKVLMVTYRITLAYEFEYVFSEFDFATYKNGDFTGDH